MSDRNSESGLGAFLAGFIIGGLVGAAVALVLAPHSGEETRSRFAERSVEWRNYVDENRHQWVDGLNQVGRSATSAIGGIDLNALTRNRDAAENAEDSSET